MEDARPYPRWWQDRARERRAELDLAVQRLRAIAPTIPHLVGFLVFGSYARERVGPHSDLDLMAVTDDPHPEPTKRYVHVASRLDLKVPYDLVVYERAEFERLSRERAFVADAVRDGVWIDAAPPR